MASGSAGNSVYIETDSHKILLDAGLSEKKLSARLASIGREVKDLDAVFVTHEHSDHVSGIGPLVRKHNIPLFTTEGTFRKIKSRIGRIPAWSAICSEEPVVIGDMVVEPYATPHDAEESVAFVIRCGNTKIGHATDLGKVTPFVREKLKKSTALLVEANHDINMLEVGPYPWPLKQRIKSDVGHLSNEACGELLADANHDGLRLVVLMHLSDTNNLPELATLTAEQALGQRASQIKMVLAQQDRPTELLSVNAPLRGEAPLHGEE
ncbi:MAG: MBL fold metallo-hydrolase, partial [Proteobacteria bacterium]|nr:MBL fold metallo-hydrolase [Pseudomonadota bacterium]